MGRALPIVERTRKTCYFSRQGSLISQNTIALAMGSMSNETAFSKDFFVIPYNANYRYQQQYY